MCGRGWAWGWGVGEAWVGVGEAWQDRPLPRIRDHVNEHVEPILLRPEEDTLDYGVKVARTVVHQLHRRQEGDF